MLSKVLSSATVGLDAVLIKVEVDVAERGFPTFTIVGLPNKSIDESKERVRTAIRNSNYEMPDSKIVVNLAPADIPKEGSLFDLPIAIGILASSGAISKELLRNSLFVGELSLDGLIRPVHGILPIATLTKDKRITNLFIPKQNENEASLVDRIQVFAVNKLIDIILHLNNEVLINKSKKISLTKLRKEQIYEYDMKDVKGQEVAKRALEIAAAGFHNLQRLWTQYYLQ